MKLQIAFDLTDLEHALEIASAIHEHADIFEVGSLLIFKHGDVAVRSFKERFPHKVILADVKVADRSKEAVTLFAHAGADWVTVMAGTGRNAIHAACSTAHELGKKVMLDLLDASSLGQSALEAKSMGADALLLHRVTGGDDQTTFQDRWEMVRGNTQLPIFIASCADHDDLQELITLAPAGIVIGKIITNADNPLAEITTIRELLP